MKAEIYNEKWGMTKALKSLKTLNNIVEARRDAAKRGEVLNDFVLFGSCYLDSSGQVWGNGNPETTRAAFPDIPKVLTLEEYENFIDLRFEVKPSIPWSNRLGLIPKAGKICSCRGCRKGWNLDNFENLFLIEAQESLDLKAYVNRPIGDVWRAFSRRSNIEFNPSGSPIFHPPKEEGGQWKQLRLVSLGGPIDENYKIQKGDVAAFIGYKYYHPECRIKEVTNHWKKIFKQCLKDAGFKQISFEVIPNEYGPSVYYGRWFMVPTEVGNLKIGRRKRVTNVDWTSATEESLAFLFEDQGTISQLTRTDEYVHAWTEEQLTEFLSRIRKHLSGEKVVLDVVEA
jgi:hypothetical protein